MISAVNGCVLPSYAARLLSRSCLSGDAPKARRV